MKYIQLKVEDEHHRKLKTLASDNGKGLVEFCLEYLARGIDSEFAGTKIKEPSKESKECDWCGYEIALRNPSGDCDHLYYPDNVNKEKKPKDKVYGITKEDSMR